VFVRVKSGSPNCGSEAWTEIFLLYPLTGASIAHKLLARGLQQCPLTLPTTTPSESPLLCISVWRCLLSWERTGHLIWRAIYLEGSPLGGLFFVCVILSLSCLRGWINFLFATRWSTPFLWRS
jgi:hypothetical protein